MPAALPFIDLNPLDWLGDQAKEGLADGFASMMMGLWSAGVWLLQTAFSLIDEFTPNVNDPDLNTLHSITLWIGLAIALTVASAQIGIAVMRQDGRGFGTLVAGVVQYGAVVSCWVGVCAVVIAGTAGLSEGILRTLLGVDSFSGYAAGDGFVDTVSGTVQSATLGVCALFLVIPAAFGHIVIMLVRSAALLILTATMPIAAAGALSEGSRAWMWKSVRWFLACALMQPLLALVLGLGTQFAWSGMPDGGSSGQVDPMGPADPATSAPGLNRGLGQGLARGVGEGLAQVDASSSAQNIGLSVVGAVILLISCFAPLVLFRLLAFVDPGTSSGASFRSTMSTHGGVAGLLRGGRSASAGTASGAATETAPDGRTSAESGAESQTASRWQSAAVARGGAVAERAAGRVGRAVGAVMDKTAGVAAVGASLGVDVLGQAGVGDQGYFDLNRNPAASRDRSRRAHQMQVPGQPEANGGTEAGSRTDDHHLGRDHPGPATLPPHLSRPVDRGTSGPGTGAGAPGGITPADAQAAAEDGAFLA